MTEKEKMLSRQIYDTSDTELAKRREQAHDLCTAYNNTREGETEKRARLLRDLIPHKGKLCFLQGPVYIDYGNNMHVGNRFYANFNFTVLDSAPVEIGNDVMCGPNCTLVTPIHPLLPQERNYRYKADGTIYNLEWAKPIRIGDNCWLASNVTVIGGVTIGNGSVIGAGSVITRDIPANVFAAGNPCKVIRPITEADKLLKDEK